MNKRSKIRMFCRAMDRYLQSRDLHKSIKDMEQDIKSVDGAIAQLETKRDGLEDFYGIGYKILHAQIKGLLLLNKQLHDRLARKKELSIPHDLRNKIIKEDKINTEEAIIVILKTYFNLEAEEKVIPAAKDALSLALCNMGSPHTAADEDASIIIDNFFSDTWKLINTRKNRDSKFQNAMHGGYLRNFPRNRQKETEEEKPSPHN